jgi:hypothetical protein
MPTRYQQLRQAIANLAAPADEQVAWLDAIHGPLAGGTSAAGYGNDELALELDDIYHAAGDMLEHGEIREAEIDAVKPLDELLVRWSGESNAGFWTREALYTDPRWDAVRQCARRALDALPDEERRATD